MQIRYLEQAYMVMDYVVPGTNFQPARLIKSKDR